MADTITANLISAVIGGVVSFVGSTLKYQSKVNRKGRALEIGKQLLDFTTAYYDAREKTGTATNETKKEYEKEIGKINRAVRSEFESTPESEKIELLPKRVPLWVLIVRALAAGTVAILLILLYGSLNSSNPWAKDERVVIPVLLATIVVGCAWIACEIFAVHRGGNTPRFFARRHAKGDIKRPP